MKLEGVFSSVVALLTLLHAGAGCGSGGDQGSGGAAGSGGAQGNGGAATTSSGSPSSTSGGAAVSAGSASTTSTGGSTSTTSTSTTSTGTTAASSSSSAAASTSSSTAASSSSSTGSVGACVFPKDYPSGNGSVTYYTLSMGGGQVNCSFPVVGENPDVVATVPFGGGQYFGAMNTADYDNAAVCGACIEVDRTDTGQKVQIMVVDQCPTSSNPKCTAGHIDLSEAAFLQIGTTQEGYLGTGNGGAVGTISWHYIACPESGGVSYLVKSGSTQYFAQILVEGYTAPITQLEVDGQMATRESYNYWQVGNGNIGGGPYQVSVTDTNGATIGATVNLSPGAVQPSNQQFPVCQ